MGVGDKGSKSNGWKGTDHIPGRFFSCMKYQAKRRKKKVGIDIQDLEDQWLLQDGRCVYTGLQLTFSSVAGKGDASLDRINSSKGYVVGNIQFVHKRVNVMKSDMGEDEFLLLCKLITEKR